MCSILVEAEMVNLEQDDATILLELKEAWKRNCKAKINREGRIVSLELGRRTSNQIWHLSENISELRSLKQLTLIRCAGLLTNLPPNLRRLWLTRCDERLVQNLCALNVGIGQKLEYFSCGGTSSNLRISGSSINNLINNVAKFPRLKLLSLGRVADPDQMLQSLQQNGPVLGNKLRGIGIGRSKLSEDHLSTLMFETLQTYDHLKSLVVGNHIVSLRNIADRLESEPFLPSYSRGLTRLLLDENPVLEKIKNNDPHEIAALLKILSRFQRIRQIQELPSSTVNGCGPRIEYALRSNHAGRILVEGNSNNNVPLSVWPIVLARSYNKSPPKAVPVASTTEGAATPGTENNNKTKEPTGLFYLIRHGPIIDAIASQRRETPENENKKRKLASSLSSSLSKRPTRRSRRLR